MLGSFLGRLAALVRLPGLHQEVNKYSRDTAAKAHTVRPAQIRTFPRLLSSMPKRSAAKKKQDDFEYDDPDTKEDADAVRDEAEEEKPKKRAKKKKEPVNQEPHVAVEGPKWMIHPPWLIYKKDEDGPASSTKIAGFDLDGTLIMQKSSARYATTASDWKFYNADVPKKVKQFYDDGYKVVVFSNQGGIASQLEGKMSLKLRERVEQAFEKLQVPATIMYATGKEGCGVRKPETGMWDFFVDHLNDGVQPDKSESFFVGDAGGRLGDFSDSDKKFAECIGIAYKTPEEVFGEGPKKDVGLLKEGEANHNPELGAAFDQLADHYADEPFKASAFRKVGRAINNYPEKITSSKQVGHVKGIGKGSMQKIDEFLTTGKLADLEAAGGVERPNAEALQSDAKMAAAFL